MTTKNFENITGGCPCESFNCDSLNEIAESCKDLTSNKNYQFCYMSNKKRHLTSVFKNVKLMNVTESALRHSMLNLNDAHVRQNAHVNQ